MIWNGAFMNETGNYGVSAELGPKNGMDSTVLVFYIRKNNTPDAWNITFRLPAQDADEIRRVNEPAEWVWQQGVEVLDRSSRTNCLRNGEFLLNPAYLRTFQNATLDELTRTVT